MEIYFVFRYVGSCTKVIEEQKNNNVNKTIATLYARATVYCVTAAVEFGPFGVDHILNN